MKNLHNVKPSPNMTTTTTSTITTPTPSSNGTHAGDESSMTSTASSAPSVSAVPSLSSGLNSGLNSGLLFHTDETCSSISSFQSTSDASLAGSSYSLLEHSSSMSSPFRFDSVDAVSLASMDMSTGDGMMGTSFLLESPSLISETEGGEQETVQISVSDVHAFAQPSAISELH